MSKFQRFFSNRQIIDILFIVTLCLLSLLFFSKLFYPHLAIIATPEIGVSDIWYFNFPLKDFLHKNLLQGTLPLWSREMGGGFPVLAEGQIGALNLYNLIAFKILPTIYAFNIGYMVIFGVTALGMYYCARRLNLSQLSSFYVAFLYAFSGFFITHISHYVLIQAAAYLPWLFLLSDIILSKKNIIAVLLFALILSQQIFAGFPNVTFITLFGIFIYATYKVLKCKTSILSISLLGLAILIGSILSAAQILPTYELMRVSIRSNSITPIESLRYTFPLVHFLAFINPFIFGNPQFGTYPHFNKFDGSIFWENTGYIGLIPIILFLLAILKIKKNKYGLFLLSIMIISALLMLGGSGPLYLIHTIPPFSYFRFPGRYLLWFLFGLALFAGYGLDIISQLLPKNKLVAYIISAFLILFSIINVFIIWFSYHSLLPYSSFEIPPESVSVISSEPHGMIYTYEKHARSSKEFFTIGGTKPENYYAFRNEIAPDLNLLYRLSVADSYSALPSKRIAYYNGYLQPTYKLASETATLNDKLLRLLSIRNTTHIVSPIILTNPELTLSHQIELKDSYKDQLFIYKNQKSLPAYYAVNQYKTIETYEDFNAEFFSKNFNPNHEVVIERQLLHPLSSKEPLESTINVIKETDQEIVLDTSTNQSSILVTRNTYYPGWKAEIDGKQETIMPVNFINQGFELPAGIHKIRIHYQPESVTYGLLISTISHALIFMYLGNWLFQRVRVKNFLT